MAAVTTYKAYVRREGAWWVIDVHDVGVTQARRLDQVDGMARDLVALYTDTDPASVRIDPEVHVDDTLDALRVENERLARQAERAAERARQGREQLMRKLKEKHLSARDIGRLTGVSHQRVTQMIGKATRNGSTFVHKANKATSAKRKSKV
jgi:hypothetical protein